MRLPNQQPSLSTQRLLLRPLMPSDDRALFAMRSYGGHHTFTDTSPDLSIEETQQYLEKMMTGVQEKKWLIWAIVEVETFHCIGTISLWNYQAEENSFELGYGLLPDYQHKGYMGEAIEGVCQFGFEELELSLIEAWTEEGHAASRTLLHRLGFVETRTVVEEAMTRSEPYVMVVYQRDRPKIK